MEAVEVWHGEYTKRHGNTVWTNIVRTEKLSDNLFLEFGHRKGATYEYVALMRGRHTNPKDAQQLYFTHKLLVRDWQRKGRDAEKGRYLWYVYDDTCIHLVEPYSTKEQAVQRLRDLAKREHHEG